MSKTLVGLVLAAVAMMVLAACGSDPTPAPAAKKAAPAAAPTATPVPVDKNITLDFIDSFPPVLDVSKGTLKFFDEVERLSGGTVVANRVGGPEVASPLEQFVPVRDRVFDGGATVGAYHTNITTLGLGDNLAANYHANKDNFTPRVECGLFEATDAAYNKLGVKFVGSIAGGWGARLWTIDKIEKPDFSGQKYRAANMYKPLIENLGGSSVPLSFGEIYTALQKNVIDGLYWGGVGALAGKWDEVLKYQYPGSLAGGGGVQILINNDAWAEMSKKQQEAVTAAVESASAFWTELANDLEIKERAELEKRGVQIVEWDAADAAAFQAKYYDLISKDFLLRDIAYGPKIAEAVQCVNKKILGN